MKYLALALLFVPALARADDAPAPDGPAAASDLPVPAPSDGKSAVAAVPPTAPPTTSAAAPETGHVPKLVLDLELYARAQQTRRPGDDLSELRLDRGELGAKVALGEHADAELRLESIRSAADGGVLGIQGNSTVVRVKIAQLEGIHTFGSFELGGALGFVPDPWIRTLEADYSAKPLSRTASERLLGWPTSDLSASIRASYGPVRAVVNIGNGEGLSYPERNSGKTTTGVLAVTAVDTPSLRLIAAGVARDGSVGVASIRDHRIGGGVTAVTPWVRAGVDVIEAYGIADRAELEALVVGGWADGKLYDGGSWRLFADIRGARLHLTTPGGGSESTAGCAVAVEPWQKDRGRLRIWLAVDRQTSTGQAMPIAGADGGDATVIMLIASALAPFEVK